MNPQDQQQLPPTSTPQAVHISRSIDPIQPVISPEIKAKHDESIVRYPELNLSEGEYVISAVRRHSIGLILPVGLTVFLMLLTLGGLASYPSFVKSNSSAVFTLPPFGDVILVDVLLTALFAIGGYIAVWVYLNNKFFLTNESVIQEVQTSLFTKREQTVNLSNIEDASFRQQGIIQGLLDYGSIRLSTQGDETTYRFNYVSNPKRQITLLNNAVEAFKNGRPVDPND